MINLNYSLSTNKTSYVRYVKRRVRYLGKCNCEKGYHIRDWKKIYKIATGDIQQEDISGRYKRFQRWKVDMIEWMVKASRRQWQRILPSCANQISPQWREEWRSLVFESAPGWPEKSKIIVEDQDDLNQGMFLIHHLLSLHLFDEELWKALWLELLLHVERVNKRLIFVVADIDFGFTLCTSARCGFLLWRHVFFLKNAPL